MNSSTPKYKLSQEQERAIRTKTILNAVLVIKSFLESQGATNICPGTFGTPTTITYITPNGLQGKVEIYGALHHPIHEYCDGELCKHKDFSELVAEWLKGAAEVDPLWK